MFALSAALLDLGYAAIPAHTVPEAHSLIAELGARVDLLILSVAVPDAQTLSLELELGNPQLRIIQLTANRRGESLILTARTSAMLQKPDSTQAGDCWMDRLRKALPQRRL